jgi:hypothetical protein
LRHRGRDERGGGRSSYDDTPKVIDKRKTTRRVLVLVYPSINRE